MKNQKGKPILNKINLPRILKENPTISTLDEACAFHGITVGDLYDEEFKKWAEKFINRHITKIRVQLKNELYKATSFKEHEMLYKLIASDDEIKRLKAGEKTVVNNTNTQKPVIQIKSDDPEMLDKLSDL